MEDPPICERKFAQGKPVGQGAEDDDAGPYDMNDPGTVQGCVRCFLCILFVVSTLCEAFLQSSRRLRRTGTPNTMGFVPDADVVQKIVSAWGRCRLHLIPNLRVTKRLFA